MDGEGLCRFGWATQRAKFNLGTDAFGYGFGGTGMKSHAGKFEKYGEGFAGGDRVGCRLDLQKVNMPVCDFAVLCCVELTCKAEGIRNHHRCMLKVAAKGAGSRHNGMPGSGSPTYREHSLALRRIFFM